MIWVLTDKHQRMPVDAEPTEAGTLELSGDAPPQAGVVSKAARYPGQLLYVSHFATCGHAEQHRRQVAARRTTPPAMQQEALFRAPADLDDPTLGRLHGPAGRPFPRSE